MKKMIKYVSFVILVGIWPLATAHAYSTYLQSDLTPSNRLLHKQLGFI